MTNKSSNPSRSLRAVIVGAGLMGRWHADAVRHIGGTVSAVVDRNPKRAAHLARHSGAEVAIDLADVLKRNLADVVHICTPGNTHQHLAQEALESGWHALVEKPLTETAESTSKLLQLSESNRLLLCPVHQFLFQPGILRIGAQIGKIGPLLHIDTVICSAGAAHDPENADLAIADILPGPLALVARFAVAPIRCADWQVEHPTKGELRASASADGVSMSVLVSMHGRPTINSLRLVGERGTAYADLFHGYALLEAGAISRARKITHPFTRAGAILYSATANLLARASRREPAYPGLRELIRRFYEAAGTGGSSPISARETLDVALAYRNILEEM